MDSVSSDTSPSVFSSPDSAVDPPNGKKFETSISVSSLAEKFEKNGDFSKGQVRRSSESRFASESEMDGEEPVQQNNLRKKSISSENVSFQRYTAITKDEIFSIKEKSDVASNESAEQATATKNDKVKIDTFKVFSDSCASPVEEKNMNASDISELPTASIVKNQVSVIQNGSNISTNSEVTKAIEERVTYFVEKISKESQNSVFCTSSSKDIPVVSPGGLPHVSSTSEKTPHVGVSSKFSLKDLEQSFVTALNMVNAQREAQEIADTLPVPSIQITEASDREDSSDDADETKPKSAVIKPKVHTPVENNREESDVKQTQDNTVITTTPSSSTTSEGEIKDEIDVSVEEHKATFYISSSDLPAESPQESVENSDETPLISAHEEPNQSPRTQQRSEKSISCLRSKTLHGVTFVVSFLVAIIGCVVFNLAHEGKIPDFCEQLGLATTILAGIVGAFSCFCYSCLDEFPGISRADYERIPGADNSPSVSPTNGYAKARILDGSPSLQKKQGTKRKYRALSHTDLDSAKSDEDEFLMIRKSEHREIIEKTQKLKDEILDLYDSFSAFISKLEQKDKVVKMESGTMNGI